MSNSMIMFSRAQLLEISVLLLENEEWKNLISLKLLAFSNILPAKAGSFQPP